MSQFSSVVRAAHELGARVVPLAASVSLLLALAASGLNGQNFAFVGYLPQDAAERAQRLRQASRKPWRSRADSATVHRDALPQRRAALLQHLQPGTRLATAAGLTLAQAQVQPQRGAMARAEPGAARQAPVGGVCPGVRWSQISRWLNRCGQPLLQGADHDGSISLNMVGHQNRIWNIRVFT